MPHIIEVMTKPEIAAMNNLRRPNLSASQPVSGVAIADAAMYGASTQVLVSVAAPRLASRCGTATLAIVESSTCMKVASMTTMVIASAFGAITPSSSGGWVATPVSCRNAGQP